MKIVSIGRQILSTFLHCLIFFYIFFTFTVWADPVKGSFKVPIKSIFNSFFTCLWRRRGTSFSDKTPDAFDDLLWMPYKCGQMSKPTIILTGWYTLRDLWQMILPPPLFHPIRHGMIKDHLGHLHLSADRESVRPIVFFTSHGIIRGTASSSLHYCSSISRLKSLLCPI